MSKDIKIKYVLVRTPETIVVDGVKYPRTQRNLDVVNEYELSQDESVLDKLSTAVIEF